MKKEDNSECAPPGISRRSFLKHGASGLAALVVGTRMPWLMENEAYAAVQVQTLNFHITDAMKEMVTHNAINDALCYFWIFKEDNFPAECPGPNIFTTTGDFVVINLTNDLDEPHAFFIPGIINSGPIAPGATRTIRFKVPKAGTYLYYDNLNEPVNRVMGLHGAFIVMPRAAVPGHKFTPFDQPTPSVQQLFDDLGTAHWPGLAWEQGDPLTDTPAFRQYVWVLHQASPNLFAEVGSLAPGVIYPAADFVQAFLHDPFSPTRANRVPQYFTICGQSGHFSHNHPFICPNNRVGEPVLIRHLNAGLWIHAMHLHVNHQFVVSYNGVVSDNPFWVDMWGAFPLDTFEWLSPYMRPPDVPNLLGIGRADISPPLISLNGPSGLAARGRAEHLYPAARRHGAPFSPGPPPPALPTPPTLPITALAQDGVTVIDLAVRLSPLCYPMHDHSEPSQTAQGGNYNLGLIAGMNVTGDRNTPGTTPASVGLPLITSFPDGHTGHGPNSTGPAAGEGAVTGVRAIRGSKPATKK